MTMLTFVEPGGRERAVEARVGESVMSAAVANDVDGIEAECGGHALCGTCHVQITVGDCEILPEPTQFETMMLEDLPNVQPNSRLACQLMADERMAGWVLRVATEDRSDSLTTRTQEEQR